VVKRLGNIWHSTSVRLLRINASDLGPHQRSGGTNLRVCLVTLHGGGKFEITQSKYRLTEEQKHDDGQKLFDFCAECVKIFINSNLGDSEEMMKGGVKLPLGFTVRFKDHRPSCLRAADRRNQTPVFVPMLVRILHQKLEFIAANR